MSMILYGSTTSPFVRRIRLFMEGMNYQFDQVNIFDPADRVEFSKISPIKRLPVLSDNGDVIFDSHVIYHHLRTRQGLPSASITESNLVSVIDGVLDSVIILLISKRSGLPVDEDITLFKLQRERIADSLLWLEQQASDGAFDDWHYATMCLLACLDWMAFRNFEQANNLEALQRIREKFAGKPIVAETMPKDCGKPKE